jgi:hypothetical protein
MFILTRKLNKTFKKNTFYIKNKKNLENLEVYRKVNESEQCVQFSGEKKYDNMLS